MGDAREQPAFLPGQEVFANVSGVWQNVESAGAEAVAPRFPTYDSTREGRMAATLQPIGRGKILGVYGPLGTSFLRPTLRKRAISWVILSREYFAPAMP